MASRGWQAALTSLPGSHGGWLANYQAAVAG